ncbi:hypothetical protein [Phyllobacterium bourgognense]|uniref:Uncharacterized protein n=1 Tax=Phyllobacterium bourgognense TaxID=314236 RepID=A0A368YUA3_9HYPH|nr:hypothetical protein [Phyllobacterium bourgognense]RCW83800.1 hypothetical protein C7476_105296 [Phyllobacterium bourgognense]
MPWKVRFRDKDFIGIEGWDPEFEFEVREALTDAQELSGSAEIIIHVKGESVDDVTVHESSDPNEFPFNGVHGYHPELGGNGRHRLSLLLVLLYRSQVLPSPWYSAPARHI